MQGPAPGLELTYAAAQAESIFGEKVWRILCPS